MGRKYRMEIAAALVLLSGFLAGTLVPELFRMGTGAYAGYLSMYGFQRYETTAVSPARLLPYLLSLRMRTLLFLWMSGYTAAGLLFHLLYAWWLAASAGMLLALFLLRGGYSGILLFVCSLFPQWILYAAMWKREALSLWRRRMGTQPDAAALARRRDLKELGGMAGLCALGCAAEAFLGMWLLKIFLQYFR